MKTKDIKLSFVNFNIFYKLIDVVNLLLVLYLSSFLFNTVIYGAVLFVLINFFLVFVDILLNRKAAILSKSTNMLVLILFVIVIVLNNIIVSHSKEIMHTPQYLFLLSMTCLLLIRPSLTSFISKKLNDSYRLRLYVNIGINLLFLIGIGFILYYNIAIQAFYFIMIICILESIYITCYNLRKKDEINEKIDSSFLKEVESYNTYKSVAFYACLAFYLGIFSYFTFLFSFGNNFDNNWYIFLGLWFVVLIIASVVAYKLLKNKQKIAYGATYIIGSLVWILSLINLVKVTKTSDFLWWSLLWSMGIGVMAAVLARFNETFKLISKVIDEEVKDDALMINTIKIHNITLMISEVFILIVLTLLSVYLGSKPELVNLVLNISNFLPILFIFISAILVVTQPIDYFTVERLKRLDAGLGNEELKTKLNRMLVKKYKRKVGVKFIMFFVKLFYHHKVYGEENVSQEKLPAIFVCNHGEFYGPVIGVSYLPYYFRPWVESQLLDKEKGYPYTYKYTFSQIKILPVFMRKFLAKSAVSLGEWAFKSFDPIPVYRSDLRSIMKTFDESVKALKEDDSILLFPESTHNTEDGKYAKGGKVGDFYTGFAHIGLKYYLETGKSVTFYPIYANKKKRKFIIGEGIEFDPNNDKKEEKNRITNELKSKMDELSAM